MPPAPPTVKPHLASEAVSSEERHRAPGEVLEVHRAAELPSHIEDLLVVVVGIVRVVLPLLLRRRLLLLLLTVVADPDTGHLRTACTGRRRPTAAHLDLERVERERQCHQQTAATSVVAFVVVTVAVGAAGVVRTTTIR